MPAEKTPLAGVKRLLPGNVLTLDAATQSLEVTSYATLREQIDPALNDGRAAVQVIRECCRQAVRRRLDGE